MAKLKSGTRIYGDAQVDQTLTVGNITISGNLVVTGTTTSVNSTVTQLEDPIFEMGAGANGAALTGADSAERGILMHYWNGSADTSAYMGWHTTNGQFEFGAAVTEGAGRDGNITVGTYGNVKAFHYYGEGDTLANVTGANVTGWVAQANYANYAGTVTDASQANITSLGNLTAFQVGNGTTTGNVLINTNGNVAATGSISATGPNSNLTIGTALANNSIANIYGNLNVTGKITGTIDATIGAKGANTNIQYNNAGNIDGSAGLTFDNTSNTVSTTALVLSGLANVGGNLNMTAATGNIKGTNLSILATTTAILNGGTSYANLTSSSVVLETSGGNVTLNNNGNLTVGTGALKVNSNAAIFSDGTANVTAMIATGSGNVGTANVGSAIVRDLSQDQIPFLNGDKRLVGESTFKYTTGTSTLTVPNATISGTSNAANVVVTSLSDTRIPFANGGKALVDSANLTFNSTSNTLSVFNATLGGTANAAEVIVTSLTPTRVPFVDSDKSLTDDITFKFTTVGSKLEVGNVDLTGSLVAANVTSNNLTSGRVTLSGTAGKLQDNTNLTFDGTVLTVTGNVAATNILTDNLRYANGTAWDLQQADGSNGDIQFNLNDNFTSSANLNFNSTGNVLTTDSLVLNSYANVTGNVIAANLRSNALTSGRVTFASTNGLLSDSSALTFGSGNLTVNGNIVTGGGSGGNISGVNYLLANIANVIDINSTGNANIGGWLNAKDTVITGNLTVTGTTTSVNTTVSQLTDPLFELGGGANGTALSTNDAYDRGLFMHTRTGGVNKDLFMGWDTSNTEFVLAKNVTVSDNVVTVPGTTDAERAANLGDLRLSNIYAYNANFGGVVFSEGNVTLGAGKFIGDLQGNVAGNISGNIKVAGANGSVQFATNVTDHFGPTVNANSIVSGTKYKIISNTGATFTSIGSLSDNNNTIFTANAAGPIGTAATVQVVTTYGDLDNAGANLVYVGGNLSVGVGTGGYVKTDYFTGTLTTSSQPNITSVGNLTSLQSNGNIRIDNTVATNGILTDNLYYANGTAWDLQQASGLDTYIQYNTSNNFAASANFTYNDSTQLFKVTGNANITSNLFTQTATVSSLTATRVTYAGTSGKLVDDSAFTFGSSTLTVPNVTMSGTAQAAEVIITSLTPTRVPFVDSDDSLTDSANMTFSGTELKVTGTANVTSTLTAANVIVTGLTGGRITFAEVTTDQLTDNANLAFDASTKTLTTDYANVITINASTNANVTGSVIAGNVYANSGTVKATTLIGTLAATSNVQSNIDTVGSLKSLTVLGTSNLNAIGNVYISGGSDGQIIKTDGAGNLSFVSNDTTRIVNGTSNVGIATSGGDAVTTINSTTILTVSGTGANVVGVVTASGNITANNITSNNFITANSTTDATSAAVGSAIHTKGGISAEGNVYAGKAVGFAVGSGNTDSAAYIQYNSTSGSLDFIFN